MAHCLALGISDQATIVLQCFKGTAAQDILVTVYSRINHFKHCKGERAYYDYSLPVKPQISSYCPFMGEILVGTYILLHDPVVFPGTFVPTAYLLCINNIPPVYSGPYYLFFSHSLGLSANFFFTFSNLYIKFSYSIN